MKKTLFILLVIINVGVVKKADAQIRETTFSGAEATLSNYNALYVINTNDEKKIAGTLRNMKNALDDPRLKGKLKLELIAFGDGVAVFSKTGKFEEALLALKKSGVVLAQCENTIRERKIEKSSLFDFINYVPSGNGEIIIRHYQGWAIVHP